MFDTKQSILQRLEDELFTSKGVSVYVKRDDLIHPLVSGNKWRKLKWNIAQAMQQKKETILTFGGAFSNHLVATAYAAKSAGIKSVGIVRGEELNPTSNDTLKTCEALGMVLKFVDRSAYQQKTDYDYLHQLSADYHAFIVPEGGANYWGIIGCQEIMEEIPISPSYIFVAQGTTTTSCGLALHSTEAKLVVVPVLKGFQSKTEMLQLFEKSGYEKEFAQEIVDSVIVLDTFHFGGYAKYSNELIDFIHRWAKKGLPLDHVYTAKAFFAMCLFIEKNGKEGEVYVFVHTGGLQGSTFHLDNAKE